MTDPATVAAGLSAWQRAVISRPDLPRDWFAASSLIHRPCNTFSVLADKGMFDRRSDPEAWGRSQYRLSEAGLAVRKILEAQE